MGADPETSALNSIELVNEFLVIKANLVNNKQLVNIDISLAKEMSFFISYLKLNKSFR